MITGIIAEYNIFHNGHKYMIDEVKRHSDAVVVVMSSSFVQRGDVAVTDKWSRAEAAVLGGADLVLELPVCYALNAAPNFAEGGVNTLNALGVVDSLAFGSECGDMDMLSRTAYTLENESTDMSEKIKSLMSEGVSYPAALSRAYGDSIDANLLSMPNNILAIEYIRALIRSNSKITAQTITRAGAGHNDSSVSSGFASASTIRSMLLNGDDVSALVPNYKNSTLRRLSRLDSAITAKLRLMSAEDMRKVSEVSEGLENRIISAARDFYGFDAIAEAIKSKRYTMSKIRRVLLAALIGFTKDIYSPRPEYIRVLAMNSRGMEVLKSAKKVCTLPIITKTADFSGKSSMFSLDMRAEDIASICADNPLERAGSMDFRKSPVICS